MSKYNTSKQAIILIHGIGEQKPLDTLRDFVFAISGKVEFRNKPDRITDLLELRRLQIPGKKKVRPLTDIYEFYWAHHMRDTKARMILTWMKSMLFRKPHNVSRKLLPFYYIGWIFIIFSLFFMVMQYKSIITILIISLFIEYFYIRIFYGYIGDAARYLNPHPDNIKQRNEIRKEGLSLLEKIHASKKYSRIVIVGHSLGSVIGYDLIKFFWANMGEIEKPNIVNQKELKSFTKSLNTLFKDNTKGQKEKIEIFQQMQHKLWRELRNCGMNWIISDFVTLGSPLAHSKMLLAKNEKDFERKKAESEYPTCPPYNSENENFFYSKTINTNDGKRTYFMPNHSSPFCCIRWYNIYFPHKNFFLGDFIAGKLSPVFGYGIRDLKVGLKGWRNTWLSHTNYWLKDPEYNLKSKAYKHPLKWLNFAIRFDYLLGKNNPK